MITEHQTTLEEEAYRRLQDEIWEKLSESARAVIQEAQSAAYAANMVHNYCFQWHFEYDEHMDKMRLAAVGLTDGEHKLLAKFWRAALAAAASIDSEDYESLAGYRVYSGNVHSYYRMLSGMVEDILEEKRTGELRDEIARREPEDLTDLPF
jgi:hypothetical protein